jgi:hypothetical protein
MTRHTHRNRVYWVFLDSHGEPLPLTPRAWRPSIYRRTPRKHAANANWLPAAAT